MARRKTLFPREHGAYAQLGAPLAAALLMATPSIPAVCLALAAIGAFLANEPLLVVLGHRGPRAKAVDGARARRRLALLAIVSGALGIAGLALASPNTRIVAAVAAVLPLVLVGFAVRRAQHSLVGEVLAAVALPALAAPVAAASGVAPIDALLASSAWGLGYGMSVVAVHRVIARHRTSAGTIDRVLAVSAVLVVAATALLARSLPIALVALPLLAVSAVLVWHPPAARHLRAIGVGLVCASSAAIAISAIVV